MNFRYPSSFESVFANTNLPFEQVLEWLVEDFLGQIELNLNQYRQSQGEVSINQPREVIFYRIKLQPQIAEDYTQDAWDNWSWLRDLDYWTDPSHPAKSALDVFKWFFLSELALTPKDRNTQVELHQLFGLIG